MWYKLNTFLLTVDVDECSIGTPCGNGRCANLIGAYYCDCDGTGYSGLTCSGNIHFAFCFTPVSCSYTCSIVSRRRICGKAGLYRVNHGDITGIALGHAPL